MQAPPVEAWKVLVQNVHLKAFSRTVEGGTESDISDPVVVPPLDVDLTRIHASFRKQSCSAHDIRGREADLASPFIAVTDTRRNGERRANKVRRAADITRKKKLSNPSRARALSLLEKFRNDMQRNTGSSRWR